MRLVRIGLHRAVSGQTRISIVAVVAALRILFEDNLVEALARARVFDALGSSGRAWPVRLAGKVSADTAVSWHEHSMQSDCNSAP